MPFMRPGRKLRRLFAMVVTCFVPIACFGEACTVTGTVMNFGIYNPRLLTPTLTTGTITFSCTASIPVEIKFYGVNGSGRDGAYLTSRHHRLNYRLFLDPARMAPLGDGLNGTQYYTNPAPPANTVVTVPIFGEIPSGQSDAVAGAYADTLTLEIDYQ
jgi:spore coat protein U-like protein